MPKQISVSIGFVTNSSSVIHHFPRELLEHPQVKAFIEKFELQDGFVGEDLWHLSHCTSFLVTPEQKAGVQERFTHNEYDSRGPGIDMDPNQVVLIYGDEYTSIASSLCSLLKDALCEKAGPDARWGGSNSYN